MNNSSLILALIQMKCEEHTERNLEKVLSMVGEAARTGAKIVCLPELFLSKYFCQTPNRQEVFALAEPIPGKTSEALSIAARENNIVLIGGTIFEHTVDGKFFSSSTVFDTDGSLVGLYRKIHIPEDPLYHEQSYFSSGDLGIQVFHTSLGKIGVLVCFDQWFPEAARIAALKGAEIIFYPSAIGHFVDDDPVEGEWKTPWTDIQRSHAIANNVFVAAVNRVGIEDRLAFFGGSFVCDCFGRIIKQGSNREETIFAEIDLGQVQQIQELWGFLRYRKPYQYQAIITPTSCDKGVTK